MVTELIINNWIGARSWVGRGWKIRRVWADTDGKVSYTIIKPKPKFKPPKGFAALFTEER